ncbi:MAG TPA: beta-ketoacyl synthase N-terminal-like domain-containing protein, partial [Bryobacteraceae bacterium]|nr:beta-ketoacyl synthase N-terminal-like domain-containing protein [Bryobacteraceae bacterium]
MSIARRVALIGGGPTGIGIGRELRDAGIDFRIYEAESDFGGVWNGTAASGRTYPSLHLISPKFNTQVADFPMPAEYPDYPNHQLMLQYIRSYARQFGLYETTNFDAKVTRLEPIAGDWRVTTSSGSSDLYPLVVVCNGLQRIPRFPQPAYPGHFDGEVIHSSQYKSAEQFRGKRVLVIGGGNSGCDIAVDAVHHGMQVFHSTRRGYYYQPKFVAGKPTPQWMLELGNRFSTKQETLEHIQQVFRLAGFDGSDYGLPAPDYPLDAAHPIMNSQVLYHIGHGDIRVVGDVISFEGRQVRFAGGEVAAIDIIVYATGYDRDLSFLDRSLLEWKSGIPDLFLHSVPRKIDNLLFMGFINSAAGLGDGLKTQGHFVCSYARAYFERSPGLDSFLLAKRADAPDIGQGYFVDSHRHLWEADLWKLLRQMRKYRDLLDGCADEAPPFPSRLSTVTEPPPMCEVPWIDEKGLERDVVHIAAGALGIQPEELDPLTNLSRYGIDSIAITEVMARISRHFGISVAPTTFFEAKHFRDLCHILRIRYATAISARYGKAVPGAAKIDLAHSLPEVGVDPRAWVARHRRARMKNLPLPAASKESQPRIAVIAMKGSFPQSPDLDALENHLRDGRDCIEEIPVDRWDWRECFGDPKKGPFTDVKHGGFLPGHDRFDAGFFNISPREAELMDPQHRLFIECVWHLIESAGYAPACLSGKKVGIFLGINLQDYTDMVNRAGIRDAVQLTGLGHMFCPNRLSFLLDIHGPSEVIDTACSSSLVAVHRAVMSILHEGCEMAIAGGANLMLTATQHIMFSKVGMLAPDGRCKTFSEDANGYVRAEGVGAVLLKRLDAAERDGDTILGVILASAENHGGAANSLTAPNPRAQAALIEDAYGRSGVDPRTIGAIECHGTGTRLGDPIEIEGLKAGFAKLYKDWGLGAPAAPHCSLGSIKSNIGHAETAAGIAGLMKILLGMRSKLLYRSLHCEKPNPLISLTGTPFKLQAETQPWKRLSVDGVEVPRRAGVSSFGAGGANVHVVLEEYAGCPPVSGEIESRDSFVFPLSAKTEGGLRDVATQLSAWLRNPASSAVALRDVAYTLQIGRDELRFRVAFVAPDMPDFMRQLDEFASNDKGVHTSGRVDHKVSGDSAPIDPRQAAANEIARRWAGGDSVDWTAWYGGDRPRRIALPCYPFSRKRFWLPLDLRPDVPAATVESVKPGLWRKQFTGTESFLTDHCVSGKQVLPGVMYLELAYAAAVSMELKPYSIRQSVWVKPLVVDEPVEVEVSVASSHANIQKVEVASFSSEGARTLHFQAKLLTSGTLPLPSATTLDSLQRSTSQRHEGTQIYAAFEAMGIHYGPTHRSIRYLATGAGTALAQMQLPPTAPTLTSFTLHPSLLDGALQAAIGMTIGANETSSDGLALPFSLESLEIVAPLSNEMWVSVRKGDGDQTLHMDLMDSDGQIAVRLSGFATRVVTPRRESSTQLFTSSWRPVRDAGRRHRPEEEKRAIFAGFDRSLIRAIRGSLPEWQCVELPGSTFMACAAQLLGELRDIAGKAPKSALVQVIVAEQSSDPMLAALSGMIQSVRLEYPRIRFQTVLVGSPHDAETIRRGIL